MRHCRFHFSSLLLAASFAVCAADEPPSVFGWTLGESTPAQLRASHPDCEELGVSAITAGPVFECPGAAFGGGGIEQVSAVFDPAARLAAVLVILDNQAKMHDDVFDRLHPKLAKRYAVREHRRPFVGDRYARYGAPGATIELSAPHLSFQATLLYQTDAFRKAFQAQQRREQQQRDAWLDD